MFKASAGRKTRQVIQIALLPILIGCSSLPADLPPRPYEAALPPVEQGELQILAESLEKRIGAERSGFALLDHAEDALRARLALIDEAQSSLDVMTYLWWGDDSGDLLLRHLLQAADRGVRVRIIVDDLLLFANDDTTLAIESNPNISIMLFNAARNRTLFGRALEGLLNFNLTNIRMHTKLFIADNRAFILGGRNFGNEYFGLNERFNFHDLDVFAIGPLALQASSFFDHYWNSNWMVPARLLGSQVAPDELKNLIHKLDYAIAKAQRTNQLPSYPMDWSDDLNRWVREMVPGRGQVVYDILKSNNIESNVTEPLVRLLDLANSQILISNAYIIPNEEDINFIRKKCELGVTIRILTNSLSSHDVPAVHSHYRRWRKQLLTTGCVRLYELRADAALHGVADTPPIRSQYFGLHSKAAVVDRRYVFVGSLNFDPRSYEINAETGILITSDELGAALSKIIVRDIAASRSWEVNIDSDGELSWTSTRGTLRQEPARNVWQRIKAGVFGILPEEYF